MALKGTGLYTDPHCFVLCQSITHQPHGLTRRLLCWRGIIF